MTSSPNDAFSQGDMTSRPIPDPTVLTTQQLLREMALLKEIITTRLDASDKAIEVQAGRIIENHAAIEKQIDHLKELHSGRMDGIKEALYTLKGTVNKQIAGLENKWDQLAKEYDKAVTTALANQEKAANAQNAYTTESITKSEKVIAERIAGLENLSKTAINTQEGQISEAKNAAIAVSARVTTIEARGAGYSASWSIGIGFIGTIVGVGGLVGLIITLLR